MTKTKELTAEERAMAISPGTLRCLGPRNQNFKVVAGRIVRTRGFKPPIAPTKAEVEKRDAVLKDLAEPPQAKKTVDELIGLYVHRGDFESAGLLKKYSHDGCGDDLRGMQATHPLDGEPKEAPCLRCGRTVGWTPPLVEGAEEALAPSS